MYVECRMYVECVCENVGVCEWDSEGVHVRWLSCYVYIVRICERWLSKCEDGAMAYGTEFLLKNA